jgi:type I restriction enzyme S subunit
MRIDEIFSFEKGVLQSSKCVPGEFNFITASSDWKTHNEYTHDCEALIFAAAASGSLGRTHYVNGKFVSSDLCFIITPKDQENLPVDLKFYHILFNELKDEIVRNTKAGTSKEAIGLGSFGKYELPYFDIDTQIEIKNKFVNSEDIKSSLTTELTHQLILVKKLRQQLLQDAVQGKLVEQNKKDEPSIELLKKIKAEKLKLIAEKKLKKEKELSPIKPEEIPFDIPENWEWCRLGELAFAANNGLYKPESYYKESGYISLRMFNIQDGEIKLDKVKRVVLDDNELKNYLLDEYDILINRVNSKELVGKAALIKNVGEPLVYESMNIRLRLANKNQLAPYISKILLERRARFYFYSIAKVANGQVSINQTQLYELLIPLPPLAEQHRIVQKLDELMQYCNELETSIKQSESQNKQLLQQVLREALRK